MTKFASTVCLVAAAVALSAGAAFAEEQTLKFRLVTMPVEQVAFTAPSDVGHDLSVAKEVGVAVFDDGRIAKKTFVIMTNSAGATGEYSGYSTYTFENGDSITASFTGSWGAETDGGDYKLISGTGAYEGATGTGRFDGVENPWEDTYLANGSFTLSTPAK